MIVALELPLKVATIIVGCIFSILFSDFGARGPISTPTPPIVALIEFFHADAVASVHPLPVSWYSISSLWVYLCSCMHIKSTLWSIADTVSSGSCPILFKVLTLNVAIWIECLHFSNFCFSLSSVADFSNTEQDLSRTRSFSTSAKSYAVWTGGLSVGHGNLSMAVFILIYRSHPYRWAVVVPRSNYLILAVEP